MPREMSASPLPGCLAQWPHAGQAWDLSTNREKPTASFQNGLLPTIVTGAPSSKIVFPFPEKTVTAFGQVREGHHPAVQSLV